MNSKPIEFTADSVSIVGPKIDGSFKISFTTGEYAWNQIKELPNLNGKNVKVVVHGE